MSDGTKQGWRFGSQLVLACPGGRRQRHSRGQEHCTQRRARLAGEQRTSEHDLKSGRGAGGGFQPGCGEEYILGWRGHIQSYVHTFAPSWGAGGSSAERLRQPLRSPPQKLGDLEGRAVGKISQGMVGQCWYCWYCMWVCGMRGWVCWRSGSPQHPPPQHECVLAYHGGCVPRRQGGPR